MKRTHPVSLCIGVDAPVGRVWEALTSPELVRRYLPAFNVNVLEPRRRLVTTHVSLTDRSHTVRWELSALERGTALTVTEVDNPTPDAAAQAGKDWAVVLEGLKSLLEKRPAGSCG